MGVHLPSRNSTCLKQSCVDLLQGQKACLCCPPQMAYPKVSSCKASGIALVEEQLSRNSSCLSWINLAKLLSAAEKIYWFLHMDCSGLFSQLLFIKSCCANSSSKQNSSPCSFSVRNTEMFNIILLFWDPRCWKYNAYGKKIIPMCIFSKDFMLKPETKHELSSGNLIRNRLKVWKYWK